MSDSPIFDRLNAERNYQRMLDWKHSAEAVDVSEKLSEPNPFLDGPAHIIGAQTFPDDHIETSALVREGLVAGLKGTPFEQKMLRYFSDSAISPDVAAKFAEKYPNLHLKVPRVSIDPSLKKDDHHGGVVWNSEEEAERQAEMTEMFNKYVSDTMQAIQNIRDQGGIITRVETVFDPDCDPKTVVEGEVPIYKPLSLDEAQEE